MTPQKKEPETLKTTHPAVRQSLVCDFMSGRFRRSGLVFVRLDLCDDLLSSSNRNRA